MTQEPGGPPLRANFMIYEENIAAERGYREGRNDVNHSVEFLRFHYTERALRAYQYGHKLGRDAYLKTLPPSQDMEATAGSEFV